MGSEIINVKFMSIFNKNFRRPQYDVKMAEKRFLAIKF